MKRVIFLLISVITGCVSQPKSTTALSAVVESYGERVTLGTPGTERTYVTEFKIVAPSAREGSILDVSSQAPLPADNLFRKIGARLKLSIGSLESGRSTFLVPAEGVTRIVYHVKMESVRVISEEPSSLRPTRLRLRSADEALSLRG
jgi:hypothetical protein